MDQLQKLYLALVVIAVACFLAAAWLKNSKLERNIFLFVGILALLFLGGCHLAIQQFNSHF